MFKKILAGVLLIGLIGVLVVGALNRTASMRAETYARGQGYGRRGQADSHEVEPVGYGGGQGRGGRWGQSGSGEHLSAADATSALSEVESEGLLYVREEEKLAHDVYLALYQKWGLPIFRNIAASEQAHSDSVKMLIERYGLQDPAADKAAGVFANKTIQQLYDQLVREGSQSPADALRVGAAIEELDLLDLQVRLTQTTRADIRMVYQNLWQGSGNHLRAFTSNLTQRTGATYQSRYLSPDAYQAIIGSTGGRGWRRNQGG